MSIIHALRNLGSVRDKYSFVPTGEKVSVRFYGGCDTGLFMPGIEHVIVGQKAVGGAFVKLRGSKIIVYPKRKSNLGTFDNRKRGNITAFSRSSGKRMVSYLESCNSRYVNLATLTYPANHPSGKDGRLAKQDFHEFIKRLRKHINDDANFSLFWFAEIQEKSTNNIHFHFFCTHFIHHEQLARLWFESHSKFHALPSKSSVVSLKTGTSIQKINSGRFGMASYAAKYAKKQGQKLIPDEVKDFGRFWGIRGCRSVLAASVEIDENSEKGQNEAEFVKKVVELSDFVDKLEKQGLVRSFRVEVLDEKEGVKKDTGCEIYQCRDSRSLMMIIKRFEMLTGQILNKKGWYCHANIVNRSKYANQVLQKTEPVQTACI